MQKCDLCIERLLTELKPICVAACPMRALDVGPIDELIRKYGEVREAEGFVYSPKVKPSIIFKAKKRFS
jgi:anaerobic dimethyl sulfoxide reductase subunit B (iron-sulfur subunit)